MEDFSDSINFSLAEDQTFATEVSQMLDISSSIVPLNVGRVEASAVTPPE